MIKYPDIHRIRQEHNRVRDMAQHDNTSRVGYQKMYEVGKLKRLASDQRRSSDPFSYKSTPLLEECLKDHAKDIKKNRLSINEEMASGTFSIRPSLAVRISAKEENIPSYINK